MSLSPPTNVHLPAYTFWVNLPKRIAATMKWIEEYLRVNYGIKAKREFLRTLADQSGTHDNYSDVRTLAAYVEKICAVRIQKARLRAPPPRPPACVDDDEPSPSHPTSPPFSPSAFFSPATPKTEASTAFSEVQSSPSPTEFWGGMPSIPSTSSPSSFWHSIPSVTPLPEPSWDDSNMFSPFLDIRVRISVHLQNKSYSKQHQLDMSVGDSVLNLIAEINELCEHRKYQLFYHLEGKKVEVDDNIYFLPISSPDVPRTFYAQIC